ncbi:hypothetical protein PG2001B_1415 [Bifidobacterium pseudolongum subsp. globosum]|uniref:Uncharacterized protein n=1 Tax=Bifidobacterium pseudolongum subsp. globosum TaxID=1690 RepID=A0A4Q5AX24_9BIFI|nr:hypothetical protein CQR55_1326 [Bifidobacterium pseudolongum subsp. globosum]RYQ38401.1 hypothetical protein PG2001B_1415 [Bifidobacterium pseudolongum subsp. globosum]RYQ41084.1 hypothetical protein PG1805B_1450 [Bifidobacterium pseudolongum subsp. globosum]RYQ67589.1 hypothetical protein PG2103B_1349 [Bifidobacterium pseudolongum subsp. globosum]
MSLMHSVRLWGYDSPKWKYKEYKMMQERNEPEGGIS